jgi:hypothetical protein
MGSTQRIHPDCSNSAQRAHLRNGEVAVGKVANDDFGLQGYRLCSSWEVRDRSDFLHRTVARKEVWIIVNEQIGVENK